MLKKLVKRYFKHSSTVHIIVVYIIFLYLKLVYVTSKWYFIWEDKKLENDIYHLDGALFAFWHNRLLFGMHIFKYHHNISALVSPHTDGKLIMGLMKAMKVGSIITGSTNRHPTEALKQIIHSITNHGKVVITPDGPRGPLYKVNSNITRIAHKYEKPLIPISCMPANYFELKTWDKMLMPKPFGKIVVIFGKQLILSGDTEIDNNILEQELNKLSYKAQNFFKH